MKKENQITQESESFIERDYVQFSFYNWNTGHVLLINSDFI